MRRELLTGEEILEYYQRGYLRPGRLFNDDEVAELREIVESVAAREAAEGRLYDLVDPELWPDVQEEDIRRRDETTGRPEHVEFLFNLWRVEPRIRPFVFDSTLARWATQLIGTPAVRLLEDNALWKEPGAGGELRWHQDFPYWPLAQPNAVTAWIALDDTDEDNGAMSMAIGSHLTGERLPAVFGTGTPYLAHLRPGVVKAIEDPATMGFDTEVVKLQAGEVSLHSSLVWHASGPNRSDRQRRAIVARFVGDGTIWLGARRYEYNYSDEEVGLRMGDPIGGDYFPLVPA